MGFIDQIAHAWNAFQNKDPTIYQQYAPGSYDRPDRRNLVVGHDGTIIASIYNRVAIDVSQIDLKHIRVDENEYFVEKIPDSTLNYIFTTEANIDQTYRDFIRDVVISMFDEGVVAIVPIETDKKPGITGAFDVETVRTGKIVQWFPEKVEIEVYNEKTGLKENIQMLKRSVCIIENPLYAIMNEPNSTLKRLINKIALLDKANNRNNSGKLDLIIQLPYLVKSKARKEQADMRKKNLEDQLANSKYGIAYTDGTENIIQLGHPVENNLLEQIEYETKLLYNQLGLTENVFNGTASEDEMLNYYNRTLEPIISAITEEMQRKFLTKTARSQGQRIAFFRDPFKLIAPAQLVELADSLSRNEIMTSNELRAQLGLHPSSEPRADELVNKNINTVEGEDEAVYDDESMTLSDEEFAQQQAEQINQNDQMLAELREMVHGELFHTGENKPAGGYASKYYDPEKAHEYYEKHKKLKGGRSTTGLNEEGIAAALYMQKQVDEEHAAELQKEREATEERIKGVQSSGQAAIEKTQADLQAALEAARNATTGEMESKRNALKASIENATNSTTATIENLREKIEGTTNEAAKRGFANQVERLIEANTAARDAMTEQFSEDYARASARYQSTAEALTSKASEEISKTKEKVTADTSVASDEFKAKVEELEEKYGLKIADEMEAIRNNPAFQEPEKKKSSGSSSASGKGSKYGRTSRYYNASRDILSRNRR